MKHCYLLTFLLLFFAGLAKAAPGDTTVVQSHTTTQLVNFGNYNAPAVFPTSNTTYRNITMTFTLGKYQCPGNPQYCGDWDYGVIVSLYTPTDTFEIGRLITPYAGISRFPYSWQHRYEFDVTDYAQYLKGNTNIRIHYSGYSGGFTANIKFHMIEGTPPRNVISIRRLWTGNLPFGDPAAVETKMNARTLTMPANAQAAALKFNITGHGANNGDNCSEFCSKFYNVLLNNSLIAQKNIWRDNCGLNNLYPQTGTWIYDRANWCPGDLVHPNFHPLNGLTPGSNYTLDVDFQAYNKTSSQASYSLEGQVIYYGAFNYQTDASLEAIIAPNDHEKFFRANPTCEEAKVRVTNTGSNTINSLEMQYGIAGGTMQTLQIPVFILPGASEEVTLPGNAEFVSMGSGKSIFTATITKVNGVADGNTLNNELQSEFTPMPVWTNSFRVAMQTNAAGSQTKWRIYDASGNVVNSRLQTASNTLYIDTVQLPSGCYRLEITDSGCNGLSWWAAQSQGNGTLQVRPLGNNTNFKLKGYFNGDFGCGFTEAFRIQTNLGSKAEKAEAGLSVYPNPAQTVLHVKLENHQQASEIVLYNTLGQQVYQTRVLESEIQVPVEQLSNGIYIMKCRFQDHTVQKKIVIRK